MSNPERLIDPSKQRKRLTVVDKFKKNPMTKEQLNKAKKLRARLMKHKDKKELGEYVELVESMKEEGIIKNKAYESYVKQYEEMLQLDDAEQAAAEAIVELQDKKQELEMMMKDQKSLGKKIDKLVEQKADELEKPKPFKVVEKFSGDEPTAEEMRGGQRDAKIKAATEKMFKMEREKALELAKAKRSQLSDHFSSYDTSSKATSSIEDAPKPEKRADTMPYKDVTKEEQNKIRNILFTDNFNYDNEDLEFVWNNTMSEEQKNSVLMGDEPSIYRVKDLIMSARQTEQFVPDYLEATNEMTVEERQVEFHKELINARMATIEKKRLEKPKNNFANNGAAGGGIGQGIPIKKIEKNEEYKQPEIFQNYEEILDSKITDDAYTRELFKGINPDTVSVLGKTDGDDAEFFRALNDVNNLQNNEEITNALSNIEILSGGDRATLFGEQDLLSTRANNPASRGNFQNDVPFMRDDNPAPIQRGRNAQAVLEVDPSILEQEDRNDTATSIALGIGVLNSAYHGMFSRSDIPNTRTSGDVGILDSMNQAMRLMGKRGLYGDNAGLDDNDMFEGRTISSRLNETEQFSNAKNPNYFKGQDDIQSKQDEIIRSMGMNQATAQGSTLPQLRDQQFSYKQAGRNVAYDGYSFIRGGKRTALMINSEFEP